MRTVLLANLSKVPLVFNLPSALVPELATRSELELVQHDRAGERRKRVIRKWISGSITLRPRGQAGDMVSVPVSCLRVPEVRRALDAWPPKLASRACEATE